MFLPIGKKKRTLVSFTATTVADGKISLNNRLKEGWYTIEVSTTDKDGTIIKDIETIELTGQQITNPISFGSIEPSKSKLEPGDKLSYTIRTNLDSIWVIHHVNRVNKDAEKQFVVTTKGNKTFSIETSEADRGGIAFDIAFIKNNRVYTDNATVSIPFSNKELSVSFSTSGIKPYLVVMKMESTH
ncbi:MAG: hypothetical protein IPP79_16840 [Chitinophagaceae bacterium]|nr:hypothetical protein [Chitinophagaceae bacterium]